jgi:putative transcriptional regulator
MTLMRTRRVVLCFGLLLLSPMLFTVALSKPEATPQSASFAGQLLVATQEMGDPRFSHTVILMVQHSKDGALGIIINRPMQEIPMASLLSALGMDAAGITATVRLFAGGPVEPQRGFILHSADYRHAGSIDIDGRVAMTTNSDILRDIGNGQGPGKSLVAFGYAGWGPGQLEQELAQGGWFLTLEEPGLVFDTDREKLWDDVTARRTIPL